MVNTEETTVETENLKTTETTDNVDIDALQAKLEESESKNKTLWDKIYKLKKESKTQDKTDDWFWKGDIENILNEREFYKENPNLSEYKDKINKFTSKGLTHEQAMKLVIDEDSTIAARQTTNNSNFTATTTVTEAPNYTKDDLWNMNQAEYKKAMSLVESGKATFNK